MKRRAALALPKNSEFFRARAMIRSAASEALLWIGMSASFRNAASVGPTGFACSGALRPSGFAARRTPRRFRVAAHHRRASHPYRARAALLLALRQGGQADRQGRPVDRIRVGPWTPGASGARHGSRSLPTSLHGCAKRAGCSSARRTSASGRIAARRAPSAAGAPAAG